MDGHGSHKTMEFVRVLLDGKVFIFPLFFLLTIKTVCPGFTLLLPTAFNASLPTT